MTDQPTPPYNERAGLPPVATRPHVAESGGTNGAAPTNIRQNDQRGSMIANRSPWLSLPDPFDNLEIRAWLDYPSAIAELWTAPPDETPDAAAARLKMACREVFLDHRGVDGQPWQDEDGVLPSPSEDEFWDRIPTPLGRAILTTFFEELTDSPLSRASRRKRSRNFRRR